VFGTNRLAIVAAVMLVVLVLPTTLMVPEAVFALGEPAAPRPIPIFTKEQLVWDSCTEERTVFLGVIRPAGFEGGVNLTLVDLPNGITGTFVPNPVILRSNDNYTMLIVNAAHDVPLGKYILNIRLVPLPDSNYRAWDIKDKSLLDTNVTLDVVHPCYDSPVDVYNSRLLTTTTTRILFGSTTTTTTTLTALPTTVTTNVSTTLTSTTTATERVADTSTYAWAISATVATIVLATVLTLQRRRK
jgi:hypothetical protein